MKQQPPDVAHELRDPVLPPVRSLQSTAPEHAPRTVGAPHPQPPAQPPV